jgi:hypothetical protein
MTSVEAIRPKTYKLAAAIAHYLKVFLHASSAHRVLKRRPQMLSMELNQTTAARTVMENSTR